MESKTLKSILTVIACTLVISFSLIGCGTNNQDRSVAAQVTITQQNVVRPDPTQIPEEIVHTVTTTTRETDLQKNLHALERERELWFSRGVKYAEAFVEGGDHALASVYDQLITAGELQEFETRYLVNVEVLSEDTDFSAEAREWNVAYSELSDKYGTGLLALLELVLHNVAFSVATEQGYIVSDSEISRLVSTIRSEFSERTLDESYFSSSDEEIKGYVSVVGSENYWANLLPRRILKDRVVSRWMSDIDRESGTGAGARALHDVAKEAIRSGQVQVYGLSTWAKDSSSEISEMLVAASDDYLKIWELSRPYKPENPADE